MTKPLTFVDWLAKACVTRDIAGDLVGDMRTDRELPRFRSLNHLLAYLERHNACSLEAAPVAWRRYRRARARCQEL